MKRVIFSLLFLFLLFSFFSCKKRQTACFDYSPGHPVLSDTVSFDAGCSEGATSFKWSFGDGSPDTTTTDPIIRHAFPAAGVYTVYLNVRGPESKLLKSHPQAIREIVVQ
jgi:PKD repeat protein